MDLQIEADPASAVVVVAVRGAVTGAAVGEFARCLDQSFAAARSLVIDMHQVSKLDPAVVGLLVEAYEQLGRVCVSSPSAAAQCTATSMMRGSTTSWRCTVRQRSPGDDRPIPRGAGTAVWPDGRRAD